MLKAVFFDLDGTLLPLHEDEFVTYKIFYKANSISYVDKEMYYYFSNDTGIMKKLCRKAELFLFA